MTDDADTTQVCYTVHSPEAEWLATYLPLTVHGMWFGSFGIVRTCNRRVASISLNQVAIPGSSPGSMGYDGVNVEVFNIDHGLLVQRTLLFRDYVERPADAGAPTLERASRTELTWRKSGGANYQPKLTHLATAIMALIDVFSPTGDDEQLGITTVLKRHPTPSLEPAPARPATATYRPPMPRGHTDPEREPIVIDEDLPGAGTGS
jgi:hypothetical protein